MRHRVRNLVYVKSPYGPAVLKLFKPPLEEACAPLALLHYGGSGAVRVIRHDSHAMLMRRAVPGNALFSRNFGVRRRLKNLSK